WYTDVSGAGDAAFGTAAVGQDRSAALGSAADGKMDLLTVLTHELGHLAGYQSLDVSAAPHELMTATLAPGVRRDDLATPIQQSSTSAPFVGDFGIPAVLDTAAAPLAEARTAALTPGVSVDQRTALLL